MYECKPAWLAGREWSLCSHADDDDDNDNYNNNNKFPSIEQYAKM